MKIVFLDFDGVVNTPLPNPATGKLCVNLHHEVNNRKAVKLVSDFCEQFGFVVVVTSTWRLFEDDWRECLTRAGFSENVPIIGKTPRSPKVNPRRGEEIAMFLRELKEPVEDFLIFDDDSDMEQFMDRLVKCSFHKGFTEAKFEEAKNKIGKCTSHI